MIRRGLLEGSALSKNAHGTFFGPVRLVSTSVVEAVSHAVCNELPSMMPRYNISPDDYSCPCAGTASTITQSRCGSVDPHHKHEGHIRQW